mmetsp:Transcript_11892/g.34829  ORF Transcript_11892/g.34829 Transcript_11892/m.34829 type:complete len:284 (+) Transcript_11892:116-967(+)
MSSFTFVVEPIEASKTYQGDKRRHREPSRSPSLDGAWRTMIPTDKGMIESMSPAPNGTVEVFTRQNLFAKGRGVLRPPRPAPLPRCHLAHHHAGRGQSRGSERGGPARSLRLARGQGGDRHRAAQLREGLAAQRLGGRVPRVRGEDRGEDKGRRGGARAVRLQHDDAGRAGGLADHAHGYGAALLSVHHVLRLRLPLHHAHRHTGRLGACSQQSCCAALVRPRLVARRVAPGAGPLRAGRPRPPRPRLLALALPHQHGHLLPRLRARHGLAPGVLPVSSSARI